jgi:hypothetical protein
MRVGHGHAEPGLLPADVAHRGHALRVQAGPPSLRAAREPAGPSPPARSLASVRRCALPGFLDAPTLTGWCALAADDLAAAAGEIDALNVFPVADSDTGTNLSLTMRAVAEAAGRAAADGADLGDVAAAER